MKELIDSIEGQLRDVLTAVDNLSYGSEYLLYPDGSVKKLDEYKGDITIVPELGPGSGLRVCFLKKPVLVGSPEMGKVLRNYLIELGNFLDMVKEIKVLADTQYLADLVVEMKLYKKTVDATNGISSERKVSMNAILDAEIAEIDKKNE